MRTITTVGVVLTLLAAARPRRDARAAAMAMAADTVTACMPAAPCAAAGLHADKRHSDDAYTKAASDEADRLLNSKLKSICRGCWASAAISGRDGLCPAPPARGGAADNSTMMPS